jgi:hypothetical protein
MASKRKVLTLDEQIKVIELCKTKSVRKVAEELGVGKTQIQCILLWNFINSDFFAKINTVKPVLRDHSGENAKVVSYSR